ncbi:uncharacterized protein LOC135388772 [Ornithodoros turicata]|uniref:uncharacterized protein LOC135388772 n=1 Tax=Ornithodoros turicata TaxID=34597 RepID=UPI003138C0E9
MLRHFLFVLSLCLPTTTALLDALSLCIETARRISASQGLQQLQVTYSMMPVTLGDNYRVYRAPTLLGTVIGWDKLECLNNGTVILGSTPSTLRVSMNFRTSKGEYKTYTRLPKDEDSFIDVKLQCLDIEIIFQVTVDVNQKSNTVKAQDIETLFVRPGTVVAVVDESRAVDDPVNQLSWPASSVASAVCDFVLERNKLLVTLEDYVQEAIENGDYRNISHT